MISKTFQTSNGAELAGCMWIFNGATNYTLVTDGTAPQSPSGVLDVRYPSGHPWGSSPGWWQFWESCAETDHTPDYEEYYESVQFKIVGPDFETASPMVKIFGYYGYGSNGLGLPPTHGYMGIDNPVGVNAVMSSWKISYRQQDNVDRVLGMNENTGTRIVADTWHQVELYMKMNSVVDATDGLVQVWIDNVRVLNYSDVVYRTTNRSYSSGFYGRRWDPVYGGINGNTNKTREDHFRVDHVYQSAK